MEKRSIFHQSYVEKALYEEKNMTDIHNVSNTNTDSYTNYDIQYPKKATKERVEKEDEARLKEEFKDLYQLIKDDPELKAHYEAMVKTFKALPEGDKQVMYRVIMLLIELTRTFAEVAMVTSQAALAKKVEELGILNERLKNLPTILEGQGVYDVDKDETDEAKKTTARGKRSDLQSGFSAYGTAAQALRSQLESETQYVQQGLQTFKDATTMVRDFVNSFLEMIKALSSKITQ